MNAFVLVIIVVAFVAGLISGFFLFLVKFKPKAREEENSRLIHGIELLKTEIIQAKNALDSNYKKMENDSKGFKVELQKREVIHNNKIKELETQLAYAKDLKMQNQHLKQELEKLKKEYENLFKKML